MGKDKFNSNFLFYANGDAAEWVSQTTAIVCSPPDPIKLSTEFIQDTVIDHHDKVLRKWSERTNQTAIPGWGSWGQTLISIITGCKGSKSAARGKDLLNDGGFSEIKTCSKLGQMGTCSVCGNKISGWQKRCEICRSDAIKRKIDSKWIIPISSEEKLKKATDPTWWYFNLISGDYDKEIDIKSWRVNPKNDGFSMCVTDYFYNLRPNSKTKAPLNIWPRLTKFYLMAPELIYHSKVVGRAVQTLTFPKRDEPKSEPFSLLTRALDKSIENAKKEKEKSIQLIERMTLARKAADETTNVHDIAKLFYRGPSQ